MSELLLNTKWAMFQRYHVEDKFHFDEMMISDLY